MIKNTEQMTDVSVRSEKVRVTELTQVQVGIVRDLRAIGAARWIIYAAAINFITIVTLSIWLPIIEPDGGVRHGGIDRDTLEWAKTTFGTLAAAAVGYLFGNRSSARPSIND